MMFFDEFYYAGRPRLNFGWPSPNLAGAYIGEAICLLWSAPKAKGLRVTFLCIEAIYWAFLGATLSRGSIFALAVVALLVIALEAIARKELDWKIWVARLAVAAGILGYFGNFQRFAPTFVTNDRSVLNRLELWRASIGMIKGSPAFGWGHPNAGAMYCEWFQPFNQQDHYLTLVNSYLTFAVERGLPLFWFLAVVICWIAREGAHLVGEGRGRNAYACVMFWVISNGFTTLSSDIYLWVLPVASFCYICFLKRSAIAAYRWRNLLLPFAGATALISVMFGTALLVGTGNVRPQKDGSVEMAEGAWKTSGSHWVVFTDSTVFGPTPGKEIRKWWANSKGNGICRVYSEGEFSDKQQLERANVMICGQQVARMFDPALTVNPRSITIVHPSMLPRDLTWRLVNCSVQIILPEIDERGVNASWLEWAKRYRATICFSLLCGDDIRPDWPQVVVRKHEGTGYE